MLYHLKRLKKKGTNVLRLQSRVWGIIKKTFTSRDGSMIAKLYKSFVRCHLAYAVQAWSPYLKQDIYTLEKVQRRATKTISGTEKLSYEE